MNKFVASTILAAALGGAAFAESQEGAENAQAQDTAAAFASLDLNADGELSLAELQEVKPDLAEEKFISSDLDGSGGISNTEFEVWKARAAAEKPTEGMTDMDNSSPEENYQ